MPAGVEEMGLEKMMPRYLASAFFSIVLLLEVVKLNRDLATEIVLFPYLQEEGNGKRTSV